MTAATTHMLVPSQAMAKALTCCDTASQRMRDEVRASLHLAALGALDAAERLMPQVIRGTVRRWVRLLAKDTDAVTLIEYALIGGLVSLALAFILPELRGSVGELYAHVSSEVVSAAAGPAQTP